MFSHKLGKNREHFNHKRGPMNMEKVEKSLFTRKRVVKILPINTEIWKHCTEPFVDKSIIVFAIYNKYIQTFMVLSRLNIAETHNVKQEESIWLYELESYSTISLSSNLSRNVVGSLAMQSIFESRRLLWYATCRVINQNETFFKLVRLKTF